MTGKISFPAAAWLILSIHFSILAYTKKGGTPAMLKKLCAVVLSLCIATAMMIGVNGSRSTVDDEEPITICDLPAKEVSC